MNWSAHLALPNITPLLVALQRQKSTVLSPLALCTIVWELLDGSKFPGTALPMDMPLIRAKPSASATHV